MRNYFKKIRWGPGLFSLILLLLASCKKDKYYFDGGKSDPNFKGTMHPIPAVKAPAVRYNCTD
jgi:hypothetical protein